MSKAGEMFDEAMRHAFLKDLIKTKQIKLEVAKPIPEFDALAFGTKVAQDVKDSRAQFGASLASQGWVMSDRMPGVMLPESSLATIPTWKSEVMASPANPIFDTPVDKQERLAWMGLESKSIPVASMEKFKEEWTRSVENSRGKGHTFSTSVVTEKTYDPAKATIKIGDIPVGSFTGEVSMSASVGAGTAIGIEREVMNIQGVQDCTVEEDRKTAAIKVIVDWKTDNEVFASANRVRETVKEAIPMGVTASFLWTTPSSRKETRTVIVDGPLTEDEIFIRRLQEKIASNYPK